MPRELLLSIRKEDFEIQTFRAGGKGGQNANKVSAGVRVIHAASGAVGEGREYRDQPLNKKAAFDRCVSSPAFQSWLKKQIGAAMLDEANVEYVVTAHLAKCSRGMDNACEFLPCHDCHYLGTRHCCG